MNKSTEDNSVERSFLGPSKIRNNSQGRKQLNIFMEQDNSIPSRAQENADDFNQLLKSNVDLGVKSFVDTLTIDYRKTLNEYKNKIMADQRKKTMST